MLRFLLPWMPVLATLGTAAWAVWWFVLRETPADWRIPLGGQFLAIVLGWWPGVAAVTGAILATLVLVAGPDPELRIQGAIEVGFVVFVGVIWGWWLRQILLGSGSLVRRRPPTERVQVLSGVRSPSAERPPLPAARRSASSSGARSTVSPGSLPEAPPLDPGPRPAATSPPEESVVPPPPGPPPLDLTAHVLAPHHSSATPADVAFAPPLPSMAPLVTQQVDLGDFRNFVVSQAPAEPPTAVEPPTFVEIPTDLVRLPRGDSNLVVTANLPPAASVGAFPAFDASPQSFRFSWQRPETDRNSPFASLLGWFNQFSGAPWTSDELEARYGGRHDPRWQDRAWSDVRVVRDLGRRPVVTVNDDGWIGADDLAAFLRCEAMWALRLLGYPDLNRLSMSAPDQGWVAIYDAERGRQRGGRAQLMAVPQEPLHDRERGIRGLPDALVEVRGEVDVVLRALPFAPTEPLGWASTAATAVHAACRSAGLPVTLQPVVLSLFLSHWDRRRPPRLLVVEDPGAELRKIDAAIERMRRIRQEQIESRSQRNPEICDGCGLRHACPAYAGTRPRLDLLQPLPMEARQS